MRIDDDDGIFYNEGLPYPEFFNFAGVVPESIMLYSSAAFVRNETNTNINIILSLGHDISPGTVWFSPSTYLNNDVFNLTRPIAEITYPNNKDVLLLKDMTFLHDIFIQCKITKSDNTNFTNQRELRCTLVREDGTTPYNAALFSNNQPDSGMHDYIQIRGHIQHNLNDLVKIKFNIAQDGKNGDQSDSKITIFRISWNILGLSSGNS